MGSLYNFSLDTSQMCQSYTVKERKKEKKGFVPGIKEDWLKLRLFSLLVCLPHLPYFDLIFIVGNHIQFLSFLMQLGRVFFFFFNYSINSKNG